MNLLRDNPDQRYIIVDTETESLALFGQNRPWNLGYIVYQNGKTLKEGNKFIKWGDLNISKDAARITGFNRNEYNRLAEDPNVVLDDLETYLSDDQYVKVLHNSHNFDAYIIKNWREALGRTNDYSYLDDTIDTNALTRAIKKGVKKIERKDWKLFMFRFANYVEKGLKTNLTALGKEFNIDVDYAALHQGLNDCKLTALVWDKLKWQILI